MGRLLRPKHISARQFGCIFHGVGRVLTAALGRVLRSNDTESIRKTLKLLGTAFLIVNLTPYLVVAADNPPHMESETLLRSSSAWDGVPYAAYPKGVPELSVLRISIPPRSKLNWHTHPMPNAAYIVSGEITVEELGGTRKQHFVAGQVVAETVNTLHRGVTGDQPVVLIVFYAGVKGMPLASAY